MHGGFTSVRPGEGPTGYGRSAPNELIKQAALKLGFEKVGIVPAVPLVEEGRRLKQWIESNYHGNMSWMERNPEMRADPRILFPGARSVVVVALNYYTDAQHVSSPETGKVSRYAWGDDYHEVLSSKLKSLLLWIQEQFPAAQGKVCVDIQPMMDKAWAQRAGLGWIGKHTNLITTDYGSWVFIGELILNIDLDYDTEQVEDHCGTCTLCIDACPTQAITEPYVVDSNKCISYATIELREATIPEHIGEHLEGWLYGCDICQDVCPWNRFQQTTEESRFQPRDGNANADLSRMMTLEHDEYVERFRGSAMKRAKLVGLQRNARTLLGTNNKH
jgi:epoxyqueuosine reductase